MIGLTGNIASEDIAAPPWLRARHVICADEAARRVVCPGSELNAFARRSGDGVIRRTAAWTAPRSGASFSGTHSRSESGSSDIAP